MLSLYVGGQAVELPEDFMLTWILKSPVFSELGSHSYPFKLKYSPHLASILGLFHRIENTANSFRELQAELRWNEICFFRGILKIKKAGDDSYEGLLYEGEGAFNYQVKDKNLRNYDMGELSFSTEDQALDYINSSREHDYPDFPFAVPSIKNDSYFDPPTEDEELKYFNYSLINGNYDLTLFTSGGERKIIVPMLYLKHVIKKLVNGLGYILRDEMFTAHMDYNKLVLYNSVSCNNTPPYTTPRIPSPYPITHIMFNMHLPRVSVSDFFSSIENYWGVAKFIDMLHKTIRLVPLKSIILSDTYIEFSKNIIDRYVDLNEQNKGTHLSMTIDGDDETLSVLKTWDEAVLKRISPSVETISNLPLWPSAEISELRFVENSEQWYVLNYDKVWQPYLDPSLYSHFVFRNSKDASITSKLSTMGDPWNVNPVMTCANKMDKYNDVAPRVFFTKRSAMYNPLLSGKSETNNFSLFFYASPLYQTPPRDLYSTYWKEFLRFKLKARLVRFKKLMTIIDLRDFDFSRKYLIFGNKYLVKEIQLSIKRDAIGVASIQCYTIDT